MIDTTIATFATIALNNYRNSATTNHAGINEGLMSLHRVLNGG